MERSDFRWQVYDDTTEAVELVENEEGSLESLTPERVMLQEVNRGVQYLAKHSSDACFKVVKIGYSLLGKRLEGQLFDIARKDWKRTLIRSQKSY